MSVVTTPTKEIIDLDLGLGGKNIDHVIIVN